MVLPAGRVTEHWAWPLTGSTGAAPQPTTGPSGPVKATVPPLGTGLTVAVSSAGWPVVPCAPPAGVVAREGALRASVVGVAASRV